MNPKLVQTRKFAFTLGFNWKVQPIPDYAPIVIISRAHSIHSQSLLNKTKRGEEPKVVWCVCTALIISPIQIIKMKDERCDSGNDWGRKRLLETINFFSCHQRKHLSMRLLTTTMRSMTENLKFLTITMRAGGKLKPIWETAGGISLRLAEVWVEISGPGNQLLLSDDKNLQNYYFCEQSCLRYFHR